MNYKELKKKLKLQGCEMLRQGKRHEIWKSPITKNQFPVPRHGSDEIHTELVKLIEKEAGVKL